jgi:hypothetical protein
MALNVKLIRLLNGEELIADVVDQPSKLMESTPFSVDPTKVTIKNPIRVVVMPQRDPKAPPSIGFAPWLEFAEDKTITLDKSHILFIVKPVQEFINQYNSLFGGIVAPSSKLILPT